MALTTINSDGVKDDSIVNADIKSDAAIALSKLASTPAVLSGSTNNTITTVTGANAIQGEANLTFDGTKLLLGGTTLSSSNERPLQVHSVDGPKIAIGRNDTSISDGNTIGGLEFYGNDANGTFVNTASIIVNADGTHGNDDKPTRMEFYTTADDASSASERLRITSGGNVGINASPSANGGLVQIRNNHAYQSGTTNLLTSASKAAFRIRTSTDSSKSLYIGGIDETAVPYIQVGNLGTDGATASYDLLLNPYGGNIGIGTTSPDRNLNLYNAATDGSCYLKIENNRSRNAAIQFTTTQGSWYVGQGIGNDSDRFMIYDGVERIGIGSLGETKVSANKGGDYALWAMNDGDSSNRYGILIQCGGDAASGTNYALGVADGDGTTQGYLTFTGGTLSLVAFTAAHPCIIPDADNPSDNSMAYPYGTLLETISIQYSKNKNDGSDTERGIRYKVQKTQSANSRKVLGAYAGSMNGGPEGQTNEHDVYVLGDGHILVNNAGGNIEVGDGICSSATAGIGQKATANPSMIIGIAQEAITFTGSETKLVAVQYGLQQFIPWT